MGGREGGRGYLCQAIATVLESFKDNEWERVQLEPKTEHDKVDIQFEYPSGSFKVIQVKSSINHFSSPNIFKWLELMVDDTPEASEYKLILIGTCDGSTKETINAINKVRSGDKDKSTEKLLAGLSKKLIPIQDKIVIDLLNMNIEIIEDSTITSFMRFLEGNGYTPILSQVELAVGALTYQFEKFSTNGTFVTREEYNDQIKSWINFCYPKIQKKAYLEVQYYYKNSFSTSLTAPKFDNKEDLLKPKREGLITLYQRINTFNLAPKPAMPQQEGSALLNQLGLRFDTGGGFTVYCEYSEKNKREISAQAKRLINIDIPIDFYNVGALKKNALVMRSPYITNQQQIYGTDEEKSQYRLLEQFRSELDEMNELNDLLEYIERYYIIPLCLRNLGEQYDENIAVKILLPKDITLIQPSDFILPGFTIIEDCIGDGLVENLLKQKSTSIIYEYPSTYSASPLRYVHRYAEDKYKQLYEEYNKYIECLFSFKYHDDNPDYHTIEFRFKELNAKESMAFPSYLLVHYDRPFEIQFEITSKQSSDIQSGKIQYSI